MQEAILFEAVTDCYGPEDCEDSTVTVATLIDILSDYDPDALVMFHRSDTYSNFYGAIRDNDIYRAKFDRGEVIDEYCDEFFDDEYEYEDEEW